MESTSNARETGSPTTENAASRRWGTPFVPPSIDLRTPETPNREIAVSWSGGIRFNPTQWIQTMIPGPYDPLKYAKQLNIEGNKLFDKKEFNGAGIMYLHAAECLAPDGDWILHSPKEERSLYLICYSNYALCLSKEKRWAEADIAWTEVIEVGGEGKSIKAHYRRGVARLNLEELNGARADLMAAKNIDPKNVEVISAFASLARKRRK